MNIIKHPQIREIMETLRTGVSSESCDAKHSNIQKMVFGTHASTTCCYIEKVHDKTDLHSTCMLLKCMCKKLKTATTVQYSMFALI